MLGLWPSVWTMGNLGRAGYGATVDGLVRDFQAILQASHDMQSQSGRIHMIHVI